MSEKIDSEEMQVVIDLLNQEILHKQRKASANRRYYEKTREERLARQREAYQQNLNGKKDYQKKYYQEHKDVQRRSHEKRKEFREAVRSFMAIEI